ncbi:MAG TPA: hypothetical protein PLE73_05970, partial [Spirochaetota bacterium]|nr:hypothetical protein [Spirochaetota bacterium]
RKFFQDLRENPEKKERLHEAKGLLEGLKGLIRKLFPSRVKDDDGDMTIEQLKNTVLELNPVVEEVRELKEGLLKDFRDL